MATRDLRSYFSEKAKENNKETRSVKVNLTPELVQTSEHVTSADAAAVNTELKTASSIQRRGKYVLNHSRSKKNRFFSIDYD